MAQLKKVLDLAGLSEVPGVMAVGRRLRQQWLAEFYDVSANMISVELNGIELIVPPAFVSHYIDSEYEPVTQKTFAAALRPGMVVADVGAHIGYYTLLAARRVGASGKVYSFEPCSETVGILNANILRNKVQNVEVHCCAVGRRHEMRTLNITGSSDSHGFYKHPLTETLRTVEIEQVPLDDLIATPLDAAKIDVEGSELEVLDGMRCILQRSKAIQLWIEWFPAGMRSAGFNPLDLPARLTDLGLRDLQVLDDGNGLARSLDETVELVQSGTLPDSWYVNLFARRP